MAASEQPVAGQAAAAAEPEEVVKATPAEAAAPAVPAAAAAAEPAPVPATSSSAPAVPAGAPAELAPAGAEAAAASSSPAPTAAAPPKPAKAAKAKAAKAAADEEPVNLKPAAASREDNLIYDLQKLAAFDIAPLHPKTDLAAYTRDSVQLLVNKIFALPRTKTDGGAAAELPEEMGFKLPRSKPVPKTQPKTRWQQFMEDRNMRKRKRSRMVWDEVSQDWKPRWGYNSIKKSQASTEWVHEVKEGDDPFADPFARKSAESRLQRARQKMREVRNKVEASGGKMNAAVPDLSRGGEKRGAEGLKEAIKRAQVSSASLGKFDRVAPNEARNLQTKQRKVNTAQKPEEEKSRYLKAATRLLTSEGNVDKAKAAKIGARDEAEGRAALKKREVLKGKGVPGKNRRSKQGGRPRRGKR